MKTKGRAKRITAVAIAALATLLIGGVLFAWSGIYSVAASEGHLAIVDWFLRFSMKSSVRTHARGIDAPPLDDADLVTLGAGHYYSGCMPCHGAPGHTGNAVFQHALPPPPDLAATHEEWRDRELFWLVKHGIKYTGMPGWSARDRNDEQWALVAFLRKLPSLSKEAYEDLALGGWKQERIANEEPSKTLGADIAQCARCHGDEKVSPRGSLVPSLAGQSEEYLEQALRDYASGARQSGVMQPIASTLSDAQRTIYVKHYARIRRPPSSASPGPASDLGRAIAQDGLPNRAIPACDSCHGAAAHITYPRLSGQSPRYLASQLRLWRSEIPRSGPLSGIMAPVAKTLTDLEIDAVAAHYGQQVQSAKP